MTTKNFSRRIVFFFPAHTVCRKRGTACAPRTDPHIAKGTVTMNSQNKNGTNCENKKGQDAQDKKTQEYQNKKANTAENKKSGAETH